MTTRQIQTHCGRLVATVLGIVLLVTLANGPAAVADLIPGDAVMITVEASNGEDSGQLSWTFPPGLTIAGKYDWSLPEAASIHGGGKTLGTVDSLTLSIDTDPQVKLGFSVSALSSLTSFTITSLPVTFPSLTNPKAFATAAVTVTDTNSNGATLTGLLTGTKAYRAMYNAAPVTWALLVDPVVAAPDFSNIGQERQPPSGKSTIPATVSSIQSEFSFTVTAYDMASGTSNFEVVPEPATMGLLAAGFIGLALRRRRR